MKNSFFKAQIGKFDGDQEKQTIDELQSWILSNYENKLKSRPSLHEYIVNTDKKMQYLVNKLRHSEQIKNHICTQYKNCNIKSLDETDELYISHYNMDGGGDQGLFDKHYDGVLRFINGASVVRILIYINSNDNYVVHFLDSKISHHFNKYEYGILDFNKEYHWVEGSYDKNQNYKDSRILLKLNYLICPECSSGYENIVTLINKYVFFLVKSCMEYSKSPKTIFQYIVGFFCNLFRVVNNISVYLTLLLILFLIYILCMGIIRVMDIIRKNQYIPNGKFSHLSGLT